jgi:carboxyl-terminal processing protease
MRACYRPAPQKRPALFIRLTAALLVAALAGCAGAPLSDTDVEASADPQATAVFRAAYGAIADRYIEPISVRTVALSGLAGWATLDPALRVEPTAATLTLTGGGQPPERLATPEAEDVEGWAQTTVALWRLAQRRSPQLAAAPAESVYQSLLEAATRGLDPYAGYASAAAASQHRARRDGYASFGFDYRRNDGRLRITTIAPGGAAERAGLRPGDVIASIDGDRADYLADAAIALRLSAADHDGVALGLRRSGRAMPRIVLRRSVLLPETVALESRDGIAIARVTGFNQATAAQLALRLAAAGRERGGVRGLILDLRGNPGGLLQASVKVADLFLTEGAIVETRGRNPQSRHAFAAGGVDIASGAPIVVLIDGGTASAAEVVAAALQDRGRAVVVGSSSYGKALVQTVVPLPNEGELFFSWSRLVPPSGTELQGRGVIPSVCLSGRRDGEPRQAAAAVAGWTELPPQRAADASASEQCPAERREDALDLAVGRRLLDHPQLYARALGTSFDRAMLAEALP